CLKLLDILGPASAATQVGRFQGVHRIEIGAAITAAQGNRFDGFAAGRTGLGIAPRGQGQSRGGLLGGRRRLLTSIRGAAANLLPARLVMDLVAAGADDGGFLGSDGGLTDGAQGLLPARPGTKSRKD